MPQRSRNQWQGVAWVYAADGSRRKTTKRFALKREAVEWERLQQSRGVASDNRVTVGELVEEHIAASSTRWSQGRAQKERSRWALHGKPLHRIRASRLTPADVSRLYAGMATTLSASSVRHMHALLGGALKRAAALEIVNRNVAALVPPPAPRPNYHLDLPTLDRVKVVIEGLDQGPQMLATFIWLALVTGRRRGELCGLKWDDIDLDERTMLIRRSIHWVDGRRIEKPTKTERPTLLQLDPVTADRLALWRVAVVEQLGVSAWVFPSHDPTMPVDPDQVSKRWAAVRDGLGVPGMKLHDWRHLHASLAIEAGMPLEAIARQLGHSSGITTAKVYVHQISGRHEGAALISGLLREQ